MQQVVLQRCYFQMLWIVLIVCNYEFVMAMRFILLAAKTSLDCIDIVWLHYSLVLYTWFFYSGRVVIFIINVVAPLFIWLYLCRFHVLQEFDEGKRSCRRRLEGHNRRRRMTRSDNATNGISLDEERTSSYLLTSLLRILSNMHGK